MNTTSALPASIAGFTSILTLTCVSNIANLVPKDQKDDNLWSAGLHGATNGEDGETNDPARRPTPRPKRDFMTTQIYLPALALSEVAISVFDFALSEWDAPHGLIVGGWVIVGIDALLISWTRSQISRFRKGLILAASTFILCSVLVLIHSSAVDNVFHDEKLYNLRSLALVLELLFGLCLVYTSCSIPRLKNECIDKKVIDGQYAVSILERITFGWIWPLLIQARTSRRIEYTDLPSLDYATRSEGLQDRFPSRTLFSNSNPAGSPLWKIIIKENIFSLLIQWAIAISESTVIMIPPICLYQILALLEKRSGGKSNNNMELWTWVLCLAAFKTAHVILDQWTQWYSFSSLAVPVRSQLSAVIFAKSLRMKATEENNNTDIEEEEEGNNVSQFEEDEAHEGDPLLPGQDTDESDTHARIPQEKKDEPQSGIVSLISIDVDRVADFCAWNVDLGRGFTQVTISASVLVYLIGWCSTLAGFAVPFLLNPLTRAASSRYQDKQVSVMRTRDNKANVVTEALYGIRQIKFSATEKQWETRILAAREKELLALWQATVWSILLSLAWIVLPVLIGAVALSVHALLGGQMTPSVAFTTLALFGCLERTINAIPSTITELIDALVSTKRIQAYLDSEERPQSLDSSPSVQFTDATIAWPSTASSPERFKLKSINLCFPNNELSIIYGKTGTGKSLVLNAIIGEADILSGSVLTPQAPPMDLRNSLVASESDWIIPNAFAYVAQVPWIENSTVKDSILFGSPYHKNRYTAVLQACALEHEISVLPHGENTKVGPTGIHLSGGQRWRLALARALYSRAGILVLDDIFSAVDSHVGKHLLNEAILGPLGNKRTKILVTHHVALVERNAAYLVELDDHRVSNVRRQKPEPVQISIKGYKYNGVTSSSNPEGEVLKAQSSEPVEDELRAFGRVEWAVYKAYLTSSGGLSYWLSILVIFALGALCTMASSWWLALWTETYTVEQSNRTIVGTDEHRLLFYLGIYLLTTFSSIVLVAIKITLVLLAALRASRHLFKTTTVQILKAPLRWLDVEPTGRILNRFVSDFSKMDTDLGDSVMGCMNGTFSLVTIIVSALFVSGWVIIPIIMLLTISLYVLYLNMGATRDIKRLESTARSPIFDLIGSTRLGLTTIRSYGCTNEFITLMHQHLDLHAQTSWYVALGRHWMALRQGLVGTLFASIVAIGVVYFGSISASLAGFALSFALNYSDVLQVTTSRYARTELSMNSTERVLEYAELETETQNGVQPAASWPTKGDVLIRNLEVGYTKDMKILKGISVDMSSGQRIGIVGRTGSGKSTLTLALFRFLEAERGYIEIDGVDISTINLHDLRARLAIIPQDPVLFSGTLRSNLDPFNQHSDLTLLDALQRVKHAKSTASQGQYSAYTQYPNLFSNLSSVISRGGSNISQGEKQLVCLARAILTQPKILVLDEATSAVDMETDAQIQRSIRNEFVSSTLIVVAHRLSTIVDFDKILVMSDGNVVEYDSPAVLLSRKEHFWRMINDSGEIEALKHLL